MAFDARLDLMITEMQTLQGLDLENLDSVIKALKDGVLPGHMATVAICAALKRIEDKLNDPER